MQRSRTGRAPTMPSLPVPQGPPPGAAQTPEPLAARRGPKRPPCPPPGAIPDARPCSARSGPRRPSRPPLRASDAAAPGSPVGGASRPCHGLRRHCHPLAGAASRRAACSAPFSTANRRALFPRRPTRRNRSPAWPTSASSARPASLRSPALSLPRVLDPTRAFSRHRRPSRSPGPRIFSCRPPVPPTAFRPPVPTFPLSPLVPSRRRPPPRPSLPHKFRSGIPCHAVLLASGCGAIPCLMEVAGMEFGRPGRGNPMAHPDRTEPVHCASRRERTMDNETEKQTPA